MAIPSSPQTPPTFPQQQNTLSMEGEEILRKCTLTWPQISFLEQAPSSGL